MHPDVYWSSVNNSPDMEANQVSINRRMRKRMWCVYSLEYFSAKKKKNKIMPFAAM